MSKRLPSPYQPTLLPPMVLPPAPPMTFPPVARASDPQTSKDAATRIEPTRGSMQAQVLALIRAYKQEGLTAAQVERYLRGKDPDTGKMIEGWWKRVSDLKARGLIVGTGQTRDGGEIYVAVEYAAP